MPDTASDSKRSRITVETLKAAIRQVGGEARWERRDPECSGLRLRVGPQSGARWSYKGRLAGKEKRWDLGPVIATRDSLVAVRERAARYRECLRGDRDPEAEEQPSAKPELLPSPLVVREPELWIWDVAVDEFLKYIEMVRRPDTFIDYRRILQNNGEIARFRGRRVADITRLEIGRMVADIHNRGVESHARHVLRVVRSLWTWLGEGEAQVASGVQPNLLLRLKAPESAPREDGDPRLLRQQLARPRAEPYLPGAESIGRALAMARAQVINPRISIALQLLIYTAQRRRAIVSASVKDFDLFDRKAPPGTCIWNIPPFYRKTARKNRDERPHRLPLSGSAAECVKKFLDEEDERNNSENRTTGFLLPVTRPRRAGERPKSETMDPSVLNDNLLCLPGVRLSPHGVRRAFATYGNELLGWPDGDSGLVLDHNEGRVGRTIERYNWTESMARKYEMLNLWLKWVDRQAEIAVDRDPMLRPENHERLAEAIHRHRYNARLADLRKRPPGHFTSNDEEIFAIEEALHFAEAVASANVGVEARSTRGPKRKPTVLPTSPPPRILLTVPFDPLARRRSE